MLEKDGKMRIIDSADLKGILRIVQSVPSSKAELLKLWLAQIGSELIDNCYNSHFILYI